MNKLEQMKQSLSDIKLWHSIINQNITAEALDVSPIAAASIQLDQIVVQLEEELGELIDANEDVDQLETLDAVVDMLYVLAQAVLSLEDAGYNVVGALSEVCANNADKFTTDYKEAEQRCFDINLGVKEEDAVEVAGATIGDKVYYFSRRVRDQKVVKPVGHPRVDLSGFLPKEEV